MAAHEFDCMFRAVQFRVWHEYCEEVTREDPDRSGIQVMLGEHRTAFRSDIKENRCGTDLLEPGTLSGANRPCVGQPVAQFPKPAYNSVKGSTLLTTSVPASQRVLMIFPLAAQWAGGRVACAPKSWKQLISSGQASSQP